MEPIDFDFPLSIVVQTIYFPNYWHYFMAILVLMLVRANVEVNLNASLLAVMCVFTIAHLLGYFRLLNRLILQLIVKFDVKSVVAFAKSALILSFLMFAICSNWPNCLAPIYSTIISLIELALNHFAYVIFNFISVNFKQQLK